MRNYMQLPSPRFLDVHGVLSLVPGLYKDGNLDKYPEPDEVVLYIGIEDHQTIAIWYKGSLRHREDGPAVVKLNGRCKWYLNGVKHRLDGPAVYGGGKASRWWIHGVKVTPATQAEFEAIMKVRQGG